MAEFALDLDHGAIALLRRSRRGGWERLDEARLDAPDLDARLRALRDTAAALSDGPSEGPIPADLLIPDSQILHLDLAVEEGWDALDARARRAAVAEALEGRTPHAAHELAFDWHEMRDGGEDGARLRVAVVAAETLREAEAFAGAYGFAPARLTAWPDPDSYPAAPDFRPHRPEPAGAAPPPAEPAPEAASEAAGHGPALASGPAPGPDDGTLDGPAVEHRPAQAPGPTHGHAETAAREPPDRPAPGPAFEPVDEPVGGPTAERGPAPAHGRTHAPPGRDHGAADAPAHTSAARGPAPVPEPTDASAAERESERRLPHAGASPSATASAAPARSGGLAEASPDRAAGILAFALRRRRAREAREAKDRLTARADGQIAGQRGGQSESAGDPVSQRPARPGAGEARAALDAGPSGGRGAPRERAQDRKAQGRRGGAPLIAGGAAAAVAIAAAFALTTLPGPDEAEVTREAAVPAAPRVAEAPSASPQPAPRPFAAEPVVVPVPPAGAPTRTAEAAVPEPDPPAEPSDVVEAAPETIPGAAPEDAPVEARAAAAAAPTDAERALASYAATGIWQVPPDPIAPPEAHAVAAPVAVAAPATGSGPDGAGGGAPVVSVALPTALPVPPAETAGDPAPAAMAPPPPPGADFELGADGRVRATPEGTTTPDGITVYAAAPPRRPPGRPPETVLPPGAAFQDPALAGARPRPRPADGPRIASGDGVPGGAPTSTETAGDGATEEGTEPDDPGPQDPEPRDPEPDEPGLDGEAEGAGPVVAATVSATAPVLSLLPMTPGDAATDAAAAAAARARAVDGAVAASLFRAPERMPEVTPAGTTIIEESTASAFAVADSVRPTARPGDAPRRAEAAPAAQAAASAPVVQAAAEPAIPTRASVARRATVENALSMNRLALVGVFGAEGAQRALVRLPSGRFEKVKVGDRIDGGRVRAIGDGRLIYVRGGRSVTLEMPRG